ncbi:MAG: anti-sigma factor [Porphyrobacter sp.]|nr:anti-sigma factor [Porphyrobacter sp.]
MTSKLTPEQAAMAAEYALGVLEGEERAEAQRLLLASPAFAAMVAKWQGRLDPLGEAFAEAPPPDVWSAIEARLDGEVQPHSVSTLRLWQGIAGLSGALAAVLAAVMVLGPVTLRDAADTAAPAAPAPVPAVIAQLSGADGTLLAARIGPDAQYLDIRAVALPDSGLTPELWVIPGDGVPRSLGLIARDGTTQVTPPEALRPLLVDGALLAVSLETPEGAPHTAPSSTPIALGKIPAI